MRPSKQKERDRADARSTALRLLARREHSREELDRKLVARGFDAATVTALLDQLDAEHLQSDARFTESYVHARRARGFGPMRIRMELEERGVAKDLIDEHLDERAAVWQDLMCAQYRKRYGDARADEYSERTRRARFLQRRGFSSDMIWRLLTS